MTAYGSTNLSSSYHPAKYSRIISDPVALIPHPHPRPYQRPSTPAPKPAYRGTKLLRILAPNFRRPIVPSYMPSS
ncbi:hypothetical protein K458DRAFT_422152 [Lentithecium fluviatile CBS 122367]|uniref:Uncharacterized protein n=1 Tax=Lentithecium fluviatile CBS 122367 TaxID=1168545 RepID=A0A6G1IMY0_9PLEO|nr:hypothetical protein K458DRAFT_422152 [Lentithecium fluviatile CBS 122367]